MATIYLGNQFVRRSTPADQADDIFSFAKNHLGRHARRHGNGWQQNMMAGLLPVRRAGAEVSTPNNAEIQPVTSATRKTNPLGTDYCHGTEGIAYSQGRFMSADPLAGDVSNPQL